MVYYFIIPNVILDHNMHTGGGMESKDREDVKFSIDTKACSKDFNSEEFNNIVSTMSDKDYQSLAFALHTQARDLVLNGEKEKGHIYWLISEACSLAFDKENRANPFQPFAQLTDGRRSASTDDFNEDGIELFSEIVESIADPMISARLSDLVWVRAIKRNIKYAHLAIDSYMEIPLDIDTWLHDGEGCWYRACDLALMLKKGAENRLKKLENKLVSTFDSIENEEGYFTYWVTKLLNSNALARHKSIEIAEKLEKCAIIFMKQKDFHRERDYFKASSDWYKVSKNIAKSNEMIVQQAEGWVAEAEDRIRHDDTGYIVAASFYEQAIQTYRQISRKNREVLGLETRVSELYQLMNNAGAKSIDFMGVIKSDAVDISESIEHAIKTVSDKSKEEAMFNFAQLCSSVNYQSLLDDSIANTKKFFFSSLMGSVYYNKDGRVIAKISSSGLTSELTAENDKVRENMMRTYMIHQDLIVSGHIVPALDALQLEHNVILDDFIDVTNNSPIIPPDRAYLFAKGLYAGYRYDFVVALYILVPQLENMVRFHLKNAGVKTTTLETTGVESEWGLNSLVQLPEMKKIFSEELTYEIQALFCDPIGANLRNQIAHGLINHIECSTISGVYAWAFIFKLVFNTFWNKARKAGSENEES